MKKLLLFLFILFFSEAAGQAPKFKTVSLLQGLSQSTVNCIIQDKQGFLWFGTQDGLNRYDGYSFRVYKHNANNPGSVPDNYIQSLYLDNTGVIWVGTYGGGLSRFDPATEKFQSYRYDPHDSLSISSNQVMSITQDAANNLWVGTSAGLNRFVPSKGGFIKYLHDPADPQSISSNKIRCILNDKQGRLWVGTADNGLNLLTDSRGTFRRFTADEKKEGAITHNFVQTIAVANDNKLLIGTSGGGVNVLDPSTERFTPLFKDQSTNIHYNDVWALNQDSRGIIWIGTYGGGMLSFDPSTQSLKNYKNDATDNSSLSNNIVLCAFTDKQGFTWLGTLGGGVSYFDPRGSTFRNIRNHPNDANSLNENVVMSVYDDAGKGLYIGTYGGGLNYYDHATGKYTFYKTGPAKGSLPSNIVRAIFEDRSGRIWIGSYGGGLCEMQNGKFIQRLKIASEQSLSTASDVWCISQDSEGFIWAGTWGDGLHRLNTSTGEVLTYRSSEALHTLSSDKVISLLIDSKQRIWAGTNGGGLNLLDKKTGKFTRYRYSDKDSSSIGSDRVRSIHEDKQGRIWVGTDGGGICRMNADGTFARYDESAGLPNNVVYGMLEDDNEHLWLSTNNGLCRFSMKDGSTRNFDITDGIQGNEFNQGARFKSSDGMMYFGGISGISVFNPNTMTSNRHLPPVVLTSVKLFGKEVTADTAKAFLKQLNLDYDQNFFSFEFAGLDYTAPEKNQYSCMMEGFDQDWISLGNRRFVSYTNLDPGEYLFKVRASNNENLWNNEGLSIKVIITPPFYKTKLFYSLLAFACVGSVYMFIFLRTRNLKAAKSALEKEVSLRTIEVVKQKEIIEEKNKDITDSINYARRIQQALFPSDEAFSSTFPRSFILYRPKDIVSGDFYWMEKFGDDVFVAVVDCTGHGVPGAFMSIVGNNLLNQAVNELGISRPSLILDQMNKGLAKMIRTQGGFELKDGMDMALCAFNLKTGKMQFAGANNPVWIMKNNGTVFLEHKGDKKPIGSFASGAASQFTNNEIDLEKGDTVYLFSDGYADQFGGDKGKKFKKSRLKELLSSIQHLDMNEQKKLLENNLDQWKGQFEQVDDVCIMGIRI